ncbi:uncharacterized protein LOC141632468 [Silene latifolia]|uniref:uncharacterized protein LOC141632468 n=1 Tax=Silene latifolia TaxID=37657 RepID=UPI003D772366
MGKDGVWQIRSVDLNHKCVFRGVNNKVNSEYLAERYLEDWRLDSNMKISKWQKQIKRDLGVDVKYGTCWLARARAKLTIYGDCSEQYGRVWDYVNAIRELIEGSTAIVVVENIERPPPYFHRIYICLKQIKEGFLAGCRPIIGVDGCHLKAAYPGLCLVAVGLDGNNNIYPVAWAIVEVQNGESWCWFLRLLMEDFGMEEGLGITIMSDRQKGIREAFNVVTPKAHVRYCVRHIWANFKLQFTGLVFKQAFWNAARASTEVI